MDARLPSVESFGLNELSQLSRREDYKLSTLRRYIEALGGELELAAKCGDETVRLHAVCPRAGEGKPGRRAWKASSGWSDPSRARGVSSRSAKRGACQAASSHGSSARPRPDSSNVLR